LLGNRGLVDAVLEDYRTAPISEREKALFAFLEKMNRESNRLAQADVDRVKTAGWDEEALYDAVTVCALFNFYNKWVDATGVCDMPAPAYAASGERLAAFGYMPHGPPAD
jgi:alkylhydroperoxidase family enzyme